MDKTIASRIEPDGRQVAIQPSSPSSPPSTDLVRSFDHDRSRPLSPVFADSERQLVFLTKLSVLDDPSSLVDHSKVFLLPGDTSRLCETGSCQAADLGAARALQVINYFLFVYCILCMLCLTYPCIFFIGKLCNLNFTCTKNFRPYTYCSGKRKKS